MNAGILIAFGITGGPFVKTLREIRKEHILKVLENANWNLKKASVILKVSEVFLKKEIHNIDPAGRKKPGKK